jgi:hypothetical protein
VLFHVHGVLGGQAQQLKVAVVVEQIDVQIGAQFSGLLHSP